MSLSSSSTSTTYRQWGFWPSAYKSIWLKRSVCFVITHATTNRQLSQIAADAVAGMLTANALTRPKWVEAENPDHNIAFVILC